MLNVAVATVGTLRSDVSIRHLRTVVLTSKTAVVHSSRSESGTASVRC